MHVTVINLQLGYASCTTDRFSKAEKEMLDDACRGTKSATASVLAQSIDFQRSQIETPKLY